MGKGARELTIVVRVSRPNAAVTHRVLSSALVGLDTKYWRIESKDIKGEGKKV